MDNFQASQPHQSLAEDILAIVILIFAFVGFATFVVRVASAFG